MTDAVMKKVQAIIKMAEQSKSKMKLSPYSRRRSSLHEIIKTKEQAERFMKELRALTSVHKSS